MWSLNRSKFRNILNVVIIYKRSLHQNHYDVLKLPQDCTQKDIKTAFIELSKQYHPDKQTDKSNSDKFVKILNAYQTLSKPMSRREYDLTLIRNVPYSNYSHNPNVQFYRPPYKRTWYDPNNEGKPPPQYKYKHGSVQNGMLALGVIVSFIVVIWTYTLMKFKKMHEDVIKFHALRERNRNQTLPPD